MQHQTTPEQLMRQAQVSTEDLDLPLSPLRTPREAGSTQVEPVRLVLIDSHRIVLESLAYRLSCNAGMTVVGTSDNGETGLHLILKTKPQVVILETELNGRGAFEIISEISKTDQHTNFILLAASLSDCFVEQALRLNVKGYLLKDEPIESLNLAIRKVAAGQICFSEAAEKRLSTDDHKKSHLAHPKTRFSTLTDRQLEVLRYLALGKSVKEVARIMHLSEKSVDSHKYRLMHKLKIHDRVELARFAIREGLSTP